MTTLNVDQRRAIDRQKEQLVPAAEQLLESARVVDISKKKLGDSQFKNLLAVANETESPAVVVNFIRYQIGRDGKGTSWANKAAGVTFGQQLIDALETGAVAQSFAAIESHFDGELVQVAKIELIRHFLGFASRYLKYLEPQRKQS
ncbi:MAG: hypothetical protein D6696_00120 [Acidobacteria bacterium]|nr:MAG: hypothetical protein D6696_00120 [Acidobacteriota bacterium]